MSTKLTLILVAVMILAMTGTISLSASSWLSANRRVLSPQITKTNPPVSEMSAGEVIEKADNQPTPKFSMGKMKMVLIDKSGRKRVRSMINYQDEDKTNEITKSLAYFTYPGDVKGTALLSWDYDIKGKEDANWLSLPAIKKGLPRRISGTERNGYFMGSDFTYDDMGHRDIDEDTYEFVSGVPSQVDGQECYVIKATPKQAGLSGKASCQRIARSQITMKKSSDEMYSKRIIWLRKDNFVMAKADFYDRDGALLKILTTTALDKNYQSLNVSSIRKKGQYWIPYYMVVENVQTGHKTVFRILAVKYPDNIDDKYFNPSTFYRN